MNARIIWLQRLMRLLILLAVLSLLFVMLDYLTEEQDQAPVNLTRLPLAELEFDRAYFLRADNKQIVVVRYSAQMQTDLFAGNQASNDSLPSYLVAYAYGTNLGCPLEESIDGKLLKESCSQAHYDFAGRPADKRQDFPALRIPVYNFCPDYSCLNVQLN